MAFPLIQAVNIQPGRRVLEIGTGQVAAVLAKHRNVTVGTLEPWEDLNAIHEYASELGVRSGTCR